MSTKRPFMLILNKKFGQSVWSDPHLTLRFSAPPLTPSELLPILISRLQESSIINSCFFRGLTMFKCLIIVTLLISSAQISSAFVVTPLKPSFSRHISNVRENVRATTTARFLTPLEEDIQAVADLLMGREVRKLWHYSRV